MFVILVIFKFSNILGYHYEGTRERLAERGHAVERVADTEQLSHEYSGQHVRAVCIM